ncbi:MAG TPA: STN domain-containing protein, partial [Puia sp.]|nr:STN domain-containing protein [Puia sp.]
MKPIFYYIISLCLFAGSTASAQNKWSITGDFSGDSFQKLVQEIESQTDYYFYYDSAQTDSLRVTLHADHFSLQQVLDAVFKGSDFRYTIRDEKYVIVTNHYNIRTALPEDFFIPEKEEPDTVPKT